MVETDTLSIVMPARNEESRLPGAVTDASQAARNAFAKYEILIVDDASTDRTGAVADRLAEQAPHIRVVHNDRPQGLGGSFKIGLSHAHMHYVTVLHGDGGTSPEEIMKIWTRRKEAEVVIPYLLNREARPLRRRLVSCAFTRLVNGLFGLNLRYHNHFVLYPVELVRSIDIRTDSHAFQAEILVKLIRAGHSFIEVGIRDRFDDAPSTSAFTPKNVLGVMRFLFDTLRDVHTQTIYRQRRVLESRLGCNVETLLEYPQFIDIDTINQCNARCLMCGIDFDRRTRRKTMPDTVFARILEDLGRHAAQIRRVGLMVNCEPLLDPSIEDKIAALKRIGIRRTYLNTNASLLTPERGRALLEAGLDVVYISLDSLRKETFEAIRRGLSFDTVYANTLAFVNLKQRVRQDVMVRISMVQQDLNRGETDAFVRHWSERLAPNDEVVVTRAYSWDPMRPPAPPPGDASRAPCIALWSSLVIDVEGDVNMCCHDSNGEVRLGNVCTESIEGIWRGAKLAALRHAHLSGRTRDAPLCNCCTIWAEDKHVMKRVIQSTGEGPMTTQDQENL